MPSPIKTQDTGEVLKSYNMKKLDVLKFDSTQTFTFVESFSHEKNFVKQINSQPG